MRKYIRKIALSVLLACGPVFAFAGCYGSFPLVKKVYQVNNSIGNAVGGGFIQKEDGEDVFVHHSGI